MNDGFEEAFFQLDQDHDGVVTVADLERHCLEKNLKESFIKKWIKLFADEKDVIYYDKFCQILGIVPAKDKFPIKVYKVDMTNETKKKITEIIAEHLTKNNNLSSNDVKNIENQLCQKNGGQWGIKLNPHEDEINVNYANDGMLYYSPNESANQKILVWRQPIKEPSLDMKALLDDKIQRISELELMTSSLESKMGENAQNLKTISKLELKIKQMNMENDIKNDEFYNELVDNLKDKRRELRERDHRIQDLESEISDIEDKLRKKEKKYDVMSKDLADTKKEIQEIEEHGYELENKYKIKCEECKGLKKSIKDKETELSEQDKFYNELNTKLDEVQRKLTEATKQLKIKEGELKQKEIDTNLKQEKKKASTDDKDQHNLGDTKKLQNLLNSKELEILQYEAKVENLNSAFEEKADECDVLTKKLETLQKELDDLKKLIFTTKDHNPNRKPNQPDLNDAIPDWWKNHME